MTPETADHSQTAATYALLAALVVLGATYVPDLREWWRRRKR